MTSKNSLESQRPKIWGYLLSIMGYFGMWWPIILGYFAFPEATTPIHSNKNLNVGPKTRAFGGHPQQSPEEKRLIYGIQKFLGRTLKSDPRLGHTSGDIGEHQPHGGVHMLTVDR